MWALAELGGCPGLDNQGVAEWEWGALAELWRKLRAWLLVGCRAGVEEAGTALRYKGRKLKAKKEQ